MATQPVKGRLYFWSIIKIIFLCSSITAADGQPIQITSAATEPSRGSNSCVISVAAPVSVLQQIDSIQYTLPPSFKKPKTITSNLTGDPYFTLTEYNVQDEFDITARIVFKDGRDTTLRHWVSLRNTSLSINKYRMVMTENTSRHISSDLWEWKVYVVAHDTILGKVDSVKYSLHPSYPQPIVVISAKGDSLGRGFFITKRGRDPFVVGVRVFFRDGEVRFLNHQLLFK